MTNEEKYKTLEERNRAFNKYCEEHDCRNCPLDGDVREECSFGWLALEVGDEKPESCPFCGAKVVKESGALKCTAPLCGYSLLLGVDPDNTVAAHNRVCRAVKAAGNGK